ncbi:serine hydrolase [Bifidobacterium sp. SMB2]|uniref:Serine hydrolase n=1 Tax=Bifidobacterium saimiriisciurei TaxID=2661627 RepID=A0ABX0CCE6_9BIFI|nr:MULTISPECIES: serine hydrolase [Bifidobacterium]NEG96765.1 serine hydrolase [Bifidobacterium sp. SMB2]NEH12331.1 serine hydrolase [Bifidobacterium saimiriisciurei]
MAVNGSDTPQHSGGHGAHAGSPRRGGLAAIVIVVVVMALLACVAVISVRRHNAATSASSVSSSVASSSKQAPSTASASATKKAVPTVDPAEAAKRSKQSQLDGLNTKLASQIAGYPGTWSVYVEDLKTGASTSINNHVQPSASVIKLYVMLAVYTKIDEGGMQEDLATNDLLTQMITVSSNQATNTLVNLLGNGDTNAGLDVVNQVAKANGFNETRMKDLLYDSGTHDSSLKQTSVSDSGRFMAKVYRGQLVSKQASEKMLNLLLQQQRRAKIPAGLPQGTKVANKTGEIIGTENDSAIIYGTASDHSSDYVLTVMTQNVENGTAQTQIAALSTTVWDTLH